MSPTHSRGFVYLTAPRYPLIPTARPVLVAAETLRGLGYRVFCWAEECLRAGLDPDRPDLADPGALTEVHETCLDAVSRCEKVLAWPRAGECRIARVVLAFAEALGIPIYRVVEVLDPNLAA